MTSYRVHRHRRNVDDRAPGGHKRRGVFNLPSHLSLEHHHDVREACMKPRRDFASRRGRVVFGLKFLVPDGHLFPVGLARVFLLEVGKPGEWFVGRHVHAAFGLLDPVVLRRSALTPAPASSRGGSGFLSGQGSPARCHQCSADRQVRSQPHRHTPSLCKRREVRGELQRGRRVTLRA